jgi:hypothetical protein
VPRGGSKKLGHSVALRGGGICWNVDTAGLIDWPNAEGAGIGDLEHAVAPDGDSLMLPVPRGRKTTLQDFAPPSIYSWMRVRRETGRE